MCALDGMLMQSQQASYRRLPRSLRILAENALRSGYPEDAAAILSRESVPIRLTPTRLVMQDLLAVPLLADLASLRDEVAKRGIDPEQINPRLPTDLVIDHSTWRRHDRRAWSLRRRQPFRHQSAVRLHPKDERENNSLVEQWSAAHIFRRCEGHDRRSNPKSSPDEVFGTHNYRLRHVRHTLTP
jgi:hypothetical protein